MRDDLQFSALHSDDALLDALGARTPGASLGVARGVDVSASGDAAARLLGAWTSEIDTRPGPLTDLLTVGAGATGAADRPLTSIETDEPAVTRLHARHRRSAMPRAAAVATASVLVLGLGGVAAAVSGGTFEPLRRAVGSVASNGQQDQDPAERASALLAAAEEALDAGDLTLAADRMARAHDLLPQVTDPKAARTLRAKMAAFQARWQRIVAPVSGALKGESSDKPSPGMLPMLVDPQQPGATPQAGESSAPAPAIGEEPNGQLVPEAGMDDPSDKVPLPDPGLHSAKEDLADTREKLRDRAQEKLDKDKLEPLPEREAPPEMPNEPMPGDLPGPASDGPLGGLDPGSRPFIL